MIPVAEIASSTSNVRASPVDLAPDNPEPLVLDLRVTRQAPATSSLAGACPGAASQTGLRAHERTFSVIVRAVRSSPAAPACALPTGNDDTDIDVAFETPRPPSVPSEPPVPTTKIAYARQLLAMNPALDITAVAKLSKTSKYQLSRDVARRAEIERFRHRVAQQTRLASDIASGALAHATSHTPATSSARVGESACPPRSVTTAHDENDGPRDETLVAIARDMPRGDNESAIEHSRRLRTRFPKLPLTDVSLLSGVMMCNLRSDTSVLPLPSELVPIRQKYPRRTMENKTDYARRLLTLAPTLTVEALSSLSGVTLYNLRRHVFGRRPASAAAPTHTQASFESASRPALTSSEFHWSAPFALNGVQAPVSPARPKTPPDGPQVVPSGNSTPTRTPPSTLSRRSTPY